MANTPLKNIRVDDDLWEQFRATAEAIGSNRTRVLVAFMRSFVAAMSPAAISQSADSDHGGRTTTVRA